MIAACDHNYRFTLVDFGTYGSINNSGVFSQSEFGKVLQNQVLNLLQSIIKLPGNKMETPCFFIGDDVFQLTNYMMKPYADSILNQIKNIFNYRLS